MSMVRAGTPQSRSSASSGLWTLPPALVAVCTVAAVLLTPAEARAPVAWCGAAATLAVALAAGEAIRRGRAMAEQRLRHAEQEALLRRRLVDQQAETVRLAEELLPAVVERLQLGVQPDIVLEGIVCETRLDPEFESAHHAVLRSVVRTVEAEEALRDSAQRAFVNIARRVQALVHQQALDLREMEDKHGNDPEVFGDLLHIDHGTALIGRLADSIAVLGGARPGRQWQKKVPLFNVLRGAMSRIIDYQRVDLHSVADIAIVGPAVEPVIHAVAELLDNATRYSPPQTRVHLTATEVQTGVAIEIEDAGVGLTDEAARRAERLLAGSASGLDINDLGESPRLGLAVVGRLAKSHAFTVSLRPSAYGGVRAVLVVPSELTAPTPTPGGDIARAMTLPPPKPKLRPLATPPIAPAGAESPFPAANGSGGLPQRRRRVPAPGLRARTAGRVSMAPPRPTGPTAAPEPPPQPGMWLAAFHNAVSGETPQAAPGRPDTHEPSGKDE
ncbi:hypothetical protein ACZ90_25900 [Streptomyces albus subsp. albus]|nr:hypothetical protein ACZ90_25900 [Streptomyces albus subsp. albus]